MACPIRDVSLHWPQGAAQSWSTAFDTPHNRDGRREGAKVLGAPGRLTTKALASRAIPGYCVLFRAISCLPSGYFILFHTFRRLFHSISFFLGLFVVFAFRPSHLVIRTEFAASLGCSCGKMVSLHHVWMSTWISHKRAPKSWASHGASCQFN